MIILVGVISVLLFILYCVDFKKNRPNLRTMVVIAMLSALSLMLSFIYIIRYPQDGGITLFSMLPIIILSLLFGRTAGITGGLIFGLLSLFNGAYIVHPVQFGLDYILAPMALGLAGIFGMERKKDIILGSSIAVLTSVGIYFLSGIIFFGQFAPPNMNVYLYSFLYNFSSAGVEGALTIVVLMFIPLKRFKQSFTGHRGKVFK